MALLTSLLFVLWVGVTASSVVDLQKRIIGGQRCPNDERGYHVVLTFNNNPFCGGSLISDQWILTAAHCWKSGGTIRAVLGRDPKCGETVEIEATPRIFPNEDIMLLKLLKPTKIKPVPLPDCKKKPNVGDEVQIAGFYSSTAPGHENEPGHVDTSKPLQCANIKVAKCDAVSKCLEEKNSYKYEHLLCYQDAKVDTSPGDSGGGVVFNGMIYGVHVRGKGYACIGPAKSMDVCSYMGWIKTTAGILPQKCGGCVGFFKKLCCIS